MANDWVQTLENRKLTPRNLQREQVGSIEEIAHALAGRFRFSGLTQTRYTVAEHCVRGSRLLPSVFAGAFLLHELSEVYLPDIPAPLKPYVQVQSDRHDDGGDPMVVLWEDLEGQHTAVILDALGLSSLEPLIYSPEVRAMDVAMLLAEKAALVGPEPEPWNVPYPGVEAHIELVNDAWGWAPDYAAGEFLRRFRELFR